MTTAPPAPRQRGEHGDGARDETGWEVWGQALPSAGEGTDGCLANVAPESRPEGLTGLARGGGGWPFKPVGFPA